MPAINRNPFAAKKIREPIGLINAGGFRPFCEVYGLADGSVTVPLESGLHTDVPVRFDVVGTLENFSDFGWDFGYFLYAAGLEDLLLKLLGVKSRPFQQSA